MCDQSYVVVALSRQQSQYLYTVHIGIQCLAQQHTDNALQQWLLVHATILLYSTFPVL